MVPVLKTGLTPSAAGSAYLELESTSANPSAASSRKKGGLKLSCTVHGPRPLQRSAPFTPQLLLSCRVKYAPFAAKQRRGYVPDASERDLAAHLETAIRGSLIGDRWPKSGLDVVITVLEGEEEAVASASLKKSEICSMMTILSGCITVASAAIADAGVDSLGIVTGGTAASVREPDGSLTLVLDPCPQDHLEIDSVCAVGYLQSRDELTEIWANGNFYQASGPKSSGFPMEQLVDAAVEAASASQLVLLEVLEESNNT